MLLCHVAYMYLDVQCYDKALIFLLQQAFVRKFLLFKHSEVEIFSRDFCILGSDCLLSEIQPKN